MDERTQEEMRRRFPDVPVIVSADATAAPHRETGPVPAFRTPDEVRAEVGAVMDRVAADVETFGSLQREKEAEMRKQAARLDMTMVCLEEALQGSRRFVIMDETSGRSWLHAEPKGGISLFSRGRWEVGWTVRDGNGTPRDVTISVRELTTDGRRLCMRLETGGDAKDVGRIGVEIRPGDIVLYPPRSQRGSGGEGRERSAGRHRRGAPRQRRRTDEGQRDSRRARQAARAHKPLVQGAVQVRHHRRGQPRRLAHRQDALPLEARRMTLHHETEVRPGMYGTEALETLRLWGNPRCAARRRDRAGWLSYGIRWIDGRFALCSLTPDGAGGWIADHASGWPGLAFDSLSAEDWVIVRCTTTGDELREEHGERTGRDAERAGSTRSACAATAGRTARRTP